MRVKFKFFILLYLILLGYFCGAQFNSYQEFSIGSGGRKKNY